MANDKIFYALESAAVLQTACGFGTVMLYLN